MDSRDDHSPKQSQSPNPISLSQFHMYTTGTVSTAGGHLTGPDVAISQSARILFDILNKGPAHDMESALSSTGINLSPDIVYEVLKLSYSTPNSAIEFFRWAALSFKHTPYSWNLMVDLLGKNRLFEATWDAIRSMKQENVLSIATFASVFDGYCKAGRLNEAIMSFDVMKKYGIKQDVIAVNSLLSAICNGDNLTCNAVEFFNKIKSKIHPDGDTYTILLEGWEKEGNVAEAKNTFGEMVKHVGWSPENMPAYDSFLTLLVRECQTNDAFTFLRLMKEKGCLPGLKFFSNALDMLSKRNDHVHALTIWDMMVDSGLLPNLVMYNSMISMLCINNDIDNMFRLFDEMIFHGVFPDFMTYKTIFRCLVKHSEVPLAASFFYEMIKNEKPPTHFDCAAAITMFVAGDDPEMAIEIWNYMIENHELPLDESANALLVGLANLGRLLEIRRLSEDMLDRKINIHESTMAKLRTAFHREGISLREFFDSLSRRWKAYQEVSPGSNK